MTGEPETDPLMITTSVPASALLVESLLKRGAVGDIVEAQDVTDRLAAVRADVALVVRDVMVLRLRTMIAKARGDEPTYQELRDRYRATAASLGFEGHMKWAEAMP